MDTQIPDKLVIQALGFGPELTARDAIVQTREFLLGLERVSPWRRPFDVSGVTAKCANMPIAEDLSDFEEVVMRALGDYKDIKYRNTNDPENWHLKIDSTSPLGFYTGFTDFVQRHNHAEAIAVGIKTPGIAPALRYNLAVISVPKFEQNEVNRSWSDASTIRTIFAYLIESRRPVYCVAYAQNQNHRTKAQTDNFNLGWLTYTRNPKFCAVLSTDPRAVEYRDGILIKFGDDASVLSSPEVDKELIQIRDRLRAAGATNWSKS